MAPKIDRKNLQKKTVRSGETLKMEADVKGEPEPAIVWTYKGQQLSNNERLKIVNEDYKTSFVYQKMKRADTGVYIVTAKNDSGTDTVEVTVTVIGKPSKPKGPLKVIQIDIYISLTLVILKYTYRS